MLCLDAPASDLFYMINKSALLNNMNKSRGDNNNMLHVIIISRPL